MTTIVLLAYILQLTQSAPPYFLSEWCRCVADMKNPRMGSTLAYIPFGDLIEAAQMRHYHKKYHKK